MRSLGILLIVISIAGCTHEALRDSTVATGNTLVDLHSRMVLDNLAMFRTNPAALPWHIKVTTGTVQVNDTVTPTFGVTWPSVSRNATISMERSWQEAWTVVPELDPQKLKNLRNLYREWASKKIFDANFAEGSHPDVYPHGHYGSRYVWAVNPDALTTLILAVMTEAPVAPGERPLMLPGAPLR